MPTAKGSRWAIAAIRAPLFVLEPGVGDIRGALALAAARVGAVDLVDGSPEVELVVAVGDVGWVADGDHPAVVEQHRAVAEALDRAHVVGDEEDRAAFALRRGNSSKHFCWKSASPTASTSSISRMSASTWIATENASRTDMPEE